MYILRDNQIPERFYGGYTPIIFNNLQEVENVLKDIVEQDMADEDSADGLSLWALLDIAGYDLELV